MTTQVNTVQGRKAASDLGRTLIHEHVLVGFPGWFVDTRMPASSLIVGHSDGRDDQKSLGRRVVTAMGSGAFRA